MTGCCGGPSIRTSWLNTCSQRQGDAKSLQASGQAPGAPCTMCVFWWSWDSLWLAAHRTSWAASAWTSWRTCGPRFRAPPEAGRRCQTAVACRSMVSPRRHVFFFFFSSFFWFGNLGCDELPNLSDHTGVGEELTPSSLVGGPRRNEEELKMGPYIYTFSKRGQYARDTLGIRQSYASCKVNSLLNRQAYAKRSMQVSDMSATH